MKKIKHILIAVILVTIIFSCNKSKEGDPAASSASVVGKWTLDAIGIKTDTKTTEATAAEIKKKDPDGNNNDLVNQSFEFKADGTVISTGEDGPEKGKYVYDSSNKTIKITSDTEKDANGKLEVSVLDVLSLSTTDMLLGLTKSSKKDSDGEFVFADEAEEFIVFIFALIVYNTKNIDVDADLAKAKSIQLTFRLKK